MARRVLLGILLAQLAGGLAIAWALADAWPRGGWLAGALLGLACVLLVRITISGNNFRMARRAGGPVPAAHRLGLAGVLRLFAGEFGASMRVSSWSMLRPRISLQIASDTAAPPVLLLHGYGCNGGYWAQLAALLSQRGISWMTLDLEPLDAGIDDYAPQIEAALERLCAASGQPRAVLIGHSMGGVAARAYLRRYGDQRVTRLITLGSPHNGTALAHLGPGLNARQMRHGAPWLAELAASETPALRALIVSLWSHHDNIVSPQDSACLPGARNVAWSGIGHVALGSHPRVLDFVLEEIAQLAIVPAAHVTR
jgi:triacylglycerol esterase/lipase EstA (alpha/beta hydrolase family)